MHVDICSITGRIKLICRIFNSSRYLYLWYRTLTNVIPVLLRITFCVFEAMLGCSPVAPGPA